MASGAGDEPRYFLDHDGRVFLVGDEGLWRLPRRTEVPFAFSEKHRAALRGATVVFGAPLDKRERGDEWPWKDELPFRDDVEPLARLASNMTLTRLVAKIAFVRSAGGRREVLLIKDKVGFYRGRWSLPGGYLDYGEPPDATAARETEEELGVKAEVVRLLRLDSQVVASGYHFVTFHYEGRIAPDASLRLKPDEIEDARWVPLPEAVREVSSPHSRLALEGLASEERAA
jgi:8-oxo-dGTP pyrophosphatase MutT (NUDIX family)